MRNDQDIDKNLTSSQQFVEGTPVYDRAGEKVGTIDQPNPQGNMLVVKQGFLFTHDIYIPMSAVTRADPDGIMLNLTKDELKSERYATPIASTATTEPATTEADVTNVTARRGVDERMPAAPPAQANEIVDQNDIRVPIVEEELVVDKESKEAGRVRVHRDVVEERQSVNVPVTHEEMRIERVPVEGEAATNVGADAFVDKDIEVPLHGEQVVTGKEARVTEEIHLHKQAVEETEHVADTVRKERVNIEDVDEQNPRTDTGQQGNDTTRRSRPSKG
ncbi:MAG: DUF2382 domain-containing protein [Ktedonobacterales bacterium]